MNTRFKTARLLLRPPLEADLQWIVALLDNYAVSKNLRVVPHPYREADGVRWIADNRDKLANGTDYAFALIRKNDEAFVGVCGVHPARDFEFGYWIGEPYWGNGYATEAGRRVVSFAFAELGAPILRARFVIDNPASGRVLTKLGFVHTHDGTCPSLARGAEIPAHVMALTRERFDSMNAS